MPSPRIAIFPGSFDPLTNGHVDLIRRATRLFDRVIVAVLVNPEKRSVFSVEDRVAMITAACAPFATADQVRADAFEGLLVHYAEREGACAVIRGLRNSMDFDYEVPMASMNAHLAPGIETVFLTASRQHAHISSRLVKEVASLGGAVDDLLPPGVGEKLLAHVRAERNAAR